MDKYFTKPLLQVKVGDLSEQGMLGIAISKKEKPYVFLYYTEYNSNHVLRNRVYRYELVNNSLVNPMVLIDLPAGFRHNGDKILIGPDQNIYVTTGEFPNQDYSNLRNSALNHKEKDANEADGRGGNLRIDQNGLAVGPHGILSERIH